MTLRADRGDEQVVVVATGGCGSLAWYSRRLADATRARTVTLAGCSGSFGHRLMSAYALQRLRDDVSAVHRLRGHDAPLLHFTSQHLARYAPWLGTRYVVTVHDLMRHRDWRERAQRSPLIHEPNLRDRLYLRLDAAGLRGADALIAVSDHTRREIVELLDIPPARVTVVPEGVDRHAFKPVARSLLSDPYVLYVGSEQPRKNLATLFRAFMRARRALPNLRLVKLGGPGGAEAPFRDATLAAARAAGALPHVLFADWVSHDDLVAWYSGALCLVHPSRHEGFGLPPLEAMACGCPVVVSTGGALPDVVADAGVVYGSPDDASALAGALERLITTPAERIRLARVGAERAAAMSWERTADLTRAVWRDTIAADAVIPTRRPRWRPRTMIAERIARRSI